MKIAAGAGEADASFETTADARWLRSRPSTLRVRFSGAHTRITNEQHFVLNLNVFY